MTYHEYTFLSEIKTELFSYYYDSAYNDATI